MKRCPRCGIEKSLSDFGPNARRADGLQSYCRACRREYVRDHYARNADRYRTATAVRNERRRSLVRKLIRKAKDRPCADCGVRYPFYVMDFDHRPGEKKLFNIGRDGLTDQSADSVRREIDKCDVVCSNCHRARTHGSELELGRQDSNLD